MVGPKKSISCSLTYLCFCTGDNFLYCIIIIVLFKGLGKQKSFSTYFFKSWKFHQLYIERLLYRSFSQTKKIVLPNSRTERSFFHFFMPWQNFMSFYVYLRNCWFFRVLPKQSCCTIQSISRLFVMCCSSSSSNSSKCFVCLYILREKGENGGRILALFRPFFFFYKNSIVHLIIIIAFSFLYKMCQFMRIESN